MNRLILIAIAFTGSVGICLALTRGRATRVPAKEPRSPIQTMQIAQDFIIKEENQEVIVRFPCPQLGHSGLVTFVLKEKSCSCMDGETDVDDGPVPVAILKFRLSPNRHKKEGAGTFSANTPEGEQLIRTIAKLEVFPPFWTEPDDIRLLTLKGGEAERIFRIRAATAFHTNQQAAPLMLMPLPAGLELISSISGTEMHKDVVVHWVETQIKYTRPAEVSGLQSTRLRWKSGEQEYEKVVYWSCSKGIECRPSLLLVSPLGSEQGISDDLEFRVVSAYEPFKVVSVACSDAELRIERNSDELLRQHTVKLGIALSDPTVRRINLTVHTSNDRGELNEVELPVIFAR